MRLMRPSAVLLAVLPFAVSAADVYYLSAAGDDAADGRTPATAWRTTAKLATGLPAGGEALLRRGDVFYGSVHLKPGPDAAHPTRLGAWGEGPRPEISLYRIVRPDPAVWEPDGEGVWRIDQADDTRFTGSQEKKSNVGFLLVDGVIRAVRRFDGRPLAGPWEFAESGSVLRVKCAVNPASAARDIRLAPRLSGIAFADNLEVRSVTVRGTGAHGANGVGRNVLFRDCEFREIGGSELYSRGPGQHTRYGNGVECWAGSSHVRVENCYFSDIYDVAFTMQGRQPPRSWEKMRVTGCTMVRCTQAIEIWASGCKPGIGMKDCVFAGNRCVDTGYGWGYDVRPNKDCAVPLLVYGLDTDICEIAVTNNVFSRSRLGLLYCNGGPGRLPKDYRIAGNRICGVPPFRIASNSGGERNAAADAAAEKRIREANTFVDTGKAADRKVLPTPAETLRLQAACAPSVPLARIGSIAPRGAPDPEDDRWMIGCEVLDRDFADFEAYCAYLVPLGIRSIRLQGGWAKCEREKGKYDFAWLDRPVDFALAHGLNPVLETDYGNPIYAGGGGRDLAAGFPSSEEGLAAWDRWVDALTTHFRGRVRDWAMWNEPDISNPAITDKIKSRKTPAEIAAFNVRTARIVKRNIPDARIAGLSLATSNPKFHEDCYRELGADIGLFHRFIYHGYAPAPEESYANVDLLKALCAKYAPQARMWQGENGCPSEMPGDGLALNHIAWSEVTQAKWDVRRMLGDLGHDVPSSVFTISDYYHPGRGIGSYGLLRADGSRQVIAVKAAFYAVRNVATLFDSAATRVATPTVSTPDQTLAFHEYERHGGRMLVWWDCCAFFIAADKKWTRRFTRPHDSMETRPGVLTHGGVPFREPLWIDLVSGGVYRIPADAVRTTPQGVTVVGVPVYDSPSVIAERQAVADCLTLEGGR